jgi:ribose transport system substrate-binding protein
MNTQARRKNIEKLLHAEGFCSVNALAKRLNVSEVTIRNDLSALEDEEKVTRIHGGAILATERLRAESFEERSTINQREKLWIARRAAELVDNYDSLILDASTTAFYVANYLKKHRGLTVITNGIEVAFRLAENHSNKVMLTGGLLRPESASLAGQFGQGVLGGVHANKAFLSCTGWSPTLDLMDDDLFEAQLKKEMVDAAESVILLADSSKFEKQGVATFAGIKQIKMVITDEQTSPTHLAQIRQAGVQVSVCSEHTTRVVEGGNNEKRFRIGFANQDNSASFQSLLQQGFVQAATAANIELLLVDNREDGPTALANAEYFVQEHLNLVVEFNTDVRYGNVIMERLRSANIPVIAIDIPMPGATFVGVDNYKAGLMGGHLLGAYVEQIWKSQVDKVLSLELPSSGPVPAARIQGQLDGLRQHVAVAEEDIIRLDSKNMYAEAHKAVAVLLPALKAAQHVVVLGINDEVVIGALAAFEEAGGRERVIAVGQGADDVARLEMSRKGSRLIGSVSFFPEYYGNLIVNLALQILQRKQVPPAVYTEHILVLSEAIAGILNLSTLAYEHISVREYANHKFSLADTAIVQLT